MGDGFFYSVCICLIHYVIVITSTLALNDYLFLPLLLSTNHDIYDADADADADAASASAIPRLSIILDQRIFSSRCSSSSSSNTMISSSRSIMSLLLSKKNNEDLILHQQQQHQQQNASKTAFFLLSYAFILLSSRLLLGGNIGIYRKKAAILYEFTWLCNTSLILSSIGLLTCRTLLITGPVIAISIDQVLWYVDLIGWVLSGFNKFPIGVARYLTWKETSWIHIITCTHHLWTIPLLLYSVGGRRGLSLNSFLFSIYIVVSHVLLSRWLTPFQLVDDNNSRRRRSTKRSGAAAKEKKMHDDNNNKNGEKKDDNDDDDKILIKYLNVNLSYELWKDIKFDFLQISYDNPTTFVYLLRLLWRWQLFNFIIFIGFLIFLPSSSSSFGGRQGV